MDVKTRKIDSIGLSKRSQNALHRAEVHTVGDLLAYTEDSLNEIRNLGKKSIEEILRKIEEYKNWDEQGGLPDSPQMELELPENFDDWIQKENGKNYVVSWLQKRDYKIDCLELLPARAYNLLMFNGYVQMDQIIFMKETELMQIPRMDAVSANEIVRLRAHFLQDNSETILHDYAASLDNGKAALAPIIFDMLGDTEYHDIILKYVRANDKDIRQLGLANRPLRCLLGQHYEKMSDLIFLTKAEFLEIPSMGSGSVNEIMTVIQTYLKENEARLLAICAGDESVLFDGEAIKNGILKLYQDVGFSGLDISQIKEKLQFPASVSDDQIKNSLDSLSAGGRLKYIEPRYYRNYGKFSDYLERCTNLDERNKDFIRKRLQGVTLEEIANEYGVTRERVRQIVKKDVQKVWDWYAMSTGMNLFDEDRYRYFYSSYSFEKKDAIQWFDMNGDICNYLDMMDVKRGKQDLESALEDYEGLDAGLRLKIKNYLNRNKLFVDGIWVEKRRASLEELVVRKFCREDVSFRDFTRIYNRFLEQEGIPFDEEIYYTEAVYRTRRNHLSDARYLLWKQNELIRYYDIEGRDFTELLDVLNLESYENIELSTLKFVKEYPEILKKYDIRDQYELHNLLRKIVPKGSLHDFHCGKMPEIKFGVFNRDEAILDILIDNAPISMSDLCTLIHDEYGYDPAVIQGTYLQAFTEYYHQGIYSINQKAMSTEHKATLQEKLTEDFYYIDEIRKIYRGLFPNADLEEVNPYNLKTMGFIVLSRYVVQNHASLEAFCEDILTREDIIDLTPYRRRFVYMQMFSQKLMELKRNLQVIEFEPNQIINFRKLEKSGVTREMIYDFCDKVYDFVDDAAYFSAQTLRQDGFESPLYELGFSDWFYANLLIADERFSYGQMFGNIILYKGKENITTQSFEMNRIREHGSIDTYDLITELSERFGCKITEHMDVVYKVQGTEIYYDKILDRLYRNYDVYDHELDEMEGF